MKIMGGEERWDGAITNAINMNDTANTDQMEIEAVYWGKFTNALLPQRNFEVLDTNQKLRCLKVPVALRLRAMLRCKPLTTKG